MDVKALRVRALKAIAHLQLRGIAPKPARGKWHRDGPCLDWHLITVGLNNLLPGLLPFAHDASDFRITAASASASDGLINYETQDVSWHELKGLRFHTFWGHIRRPWTLVLIIVQALVMEPDRWLTGWFERRGSQKRRSRAQRLGRQAPLADLTWIHSSPVVRCLQYYSWLLSGQAPRCILLWSRGGFASFEEWCDAKPVELALFSRTILEAASAMESRQLEQDFGTPWIWAGLCDRRRSEEDKALLAQEIVQLPEEQLDDWFSVLLLKSVNYKWERLLEPECVTFLQVWSWQVLLSVNQCEYAHGRNRARAHAHEHLANFAAHSLLSEKMRYFGVIKSGLQVGPIPRVPSRRQAPLALAGASTGPAVQDREQGVKFGVWWCVVFFWPVYGVVQGEVEGASKGPCKGHFKGSSKKTFTVSLKWVAGSSGARGPRSSCFSFFLNFLCECHHLPPNIHPRNARRRSAKSLRTTW